MSGGYEVAQPLMNTKDQKDGAGYAKDAEKVQVRPQYKEEFVGLNREQLERYANDPFWKTLRIILFILLWVAWITMFVAAIILVILAPKCPEKPIRHWWQKKLSYQIATRSFKDSDGDGVGDLKGVESKLGELKKIGVQTVWPSPVIKSEDPSGMSPLKFSDVDPSIGSEKDFTDLVDKVHDKDMYFVMDFPPSVTSSSHPLFTASRDPSNVASDDYYFWANHVPAGQSDVWSQDGSERRYYRHWPGKPKRPILNLNNNKVFGEISDALKLWLSRGVDGFNIIARYMAFKPDGSEDPEGAVSMFKKIRDVIDKHKKSTESDKEVLLLTSLRSDLDADPDIIENLKYTLIKDGKANLVLNDELVGFDAKEDGADKLHDLLENRMKMHEDYNETWPMWEIGNPSVDRVATRVGSVERGELMNMLLLMLPGSINTYYGDEIGIINAPGKGAEYAMQTPMQWDDSKNGGFSDSESVKLPVFANYSSRNYANQYSQSDTSVRLYKRLSKLRQIDETFLFGTCELGPRNNSLLIIGRYPETAGLHYIAVLNFGRKPVSVNLRKEPMKAPATVSVVEMTTNLDGRGEYGVRKKIDADKINLEANEGILVKYKT